MPGPHAPPSEVAGALEAQLELTETDLAACFHVSEQQTHRPACTQATDRRPGCRSPQDTWSGPARPRQRRCSEPLAGLLRRGLQGTRLRCGHTPHSHLTGPCSLGNKGGCLHFQKSLSSGAIKPTHLVTAKEGLLLLVHSICRQGQCHTPPHLRLVHTPLHSLEKWHFEALHTILLLLVYKISQSGISL